jgi:hypothetical protein
VETETAVRVRELEVIDVAEGRVQVIDRRGHYVAGFETHANAEAFVDGYVHGRQDAATIVAAVSQRLAEVTAR